MDIITNIIELIENEPRISHRVIAEQTQNQVLSVQKLITDKIAIFERFGVVRFKIEAVSETKLKENPDSKATKTYYLNEQQATFIISMMRNNDIVLYFKVRLVEEFFRMREILQNQKSQTQLPEVKNETEQIIELDNNLTVTEKLIANLETRKPTTLFRFDKIMFEQFGKSPLEHFEIDLDSQFFLPTELGRMINKSPVEVNLILEHKGFQLRENGIWKMTESGLEFGILIVGKYNQIKWKLKAIM